MVFIILVGMKHIFVYKLQNMNYVILVISHTSVLTFALKLALYNRKMSNKSHANNLKLKIFFT